MLFVINCQDLHRIFELEMTGKLTTQFVETAWSVAVTALYTIVVYHQLSGSSSNIWNGDDKKNDTWNCRKGVKCFSNIYTYDCCLSSFVSIFIDYLKWRWQEKQQHNLSKRREVLQSQLYIRLLYIINCQDFHGIFEMEMTGKATTHFVERSRSVAVTALYTIVVYHQLSGSSSNIWNGDDKKIHTSNCRKGLKFFSNSYSYDCCLSSFVSIFIDYLKWRWQEKQQHNLSKRREVLQSQLYIRLLYIINCQDFHGRFEMEMTGKATTHFVERSRSVSLTALYTIVV